MWTVARSTLRLCVALVALGVACTNATGASAPTAVFVLRSLDGTAIPAPDPAQYDALVDTLTIDAPPDADGSGVLRQSVNSAGAPPPSIARPGRHLFSWRGPNLSVLFDCQADQPCLTIYSWRDGVVSGSELRDRKSVV